MANGRRLAVETKSTEKERWKISIAEMNKKQKIADILNGELYFAVKLQDRWGLYPADYVKQQHFKINKDDLKHSEVYILGERYFIIQDELKFKDICTPEIKKSLQVKYPNYGYIERMTIELNNRPILRIHSSSITRLRCYMFILTYFSDTALSLSPQVQSIDRNRTLMTSTLPEETAFSLSSVMLNPIFHILKVPGDAHNLSSYMTDIVDKITDPEDYTYYRMHPQDVLAILYELNDKGVRIQEFRDQGPGVSVTAYYIN
ncbi:hypothetical protein [Paenibacillus kyungheensis]